MNRKLTVYEIAKLWNIPPSQVTRYCREGRIESAVKEKGIWLIPQEAIKPQRRKPNHQVKKPLTTAIRKPLPIGISSYKEACSDYYYIDKTWLLKEFLDERPKVSLFTRPRRFGKTLTMDMIKTFFEKSNEDTSIYFKDKKIWQEGAFYQNYQGKYPVIFITFKDVKKDTWDKTLDHIIQIITEEYKRHQELSASDKIQDKDYYEKILSGTADRNLFDISLYLLSKMLHEHYGTAPIVIIDEYDTPIQQGHTCGFYDEVILFMRNLFSGVLKDNKHLSYGFLTGIQRIAKESIFSGLNNLKINSILEDKYSEYFGFTPDEVKEMALYYHASDRYEEICSWYDGYQFGHTEIFNPWSVINYFGNDCQPRPFWENTGNNAIIGEVLSQADEEIYRQLDVLLQGKTISTFIDTGVIYPEIKKNPSSIYSFLLVAGYLKLSELKLSISGDFIGNVSLPNKEIALVYKKEVLHQLQELPQSVVIAIQEAMTTGNADLLQSSLQRFLLESVSSFDLINENAYHMLFLGLCAMLSERYLLRSNREAGEGRFDIQLMPKELTMPGVLIELKADKSCSREQLKKLSKAALTQINVKQYDTELKTQGVQKIFKYGVAFSGKQVEITME